jgi:hypothetical protein
MPSYEVETVLCVQDKEMKHAWCLAASSTGATSRALMSFYGKRWGIECGLRDMINCQFFGFEPPSSDGKRL